MRPDLTRPLIRRGARWEPGPRPRVNPQHFGFGVVLHLVESVGDLQRGAQVIYLGHSAGHAAVGVPRPGGGTFVRLVPGHLLDEVQPATGPLDPDWQDYREGYERGHWEALNERETGRQAVGRVPTWFGKGVIDGARDRLRGVTHWAADVHAFNTRIRTTPPSWWPVSIQTKGLTHA